MFPIRVKVSPNQIGKPSLSLALPLKPEAGVWGLSLSRRIVEEYHHGKIAVVESVIGKGTTIRITLKRIFV